MLEVFSLAFSNCCALFGAFILDYLFGDPSNKYHPVFYMGKLLKTLEKTFYKKGSIAEGLIVTLLSIIIVGGVAVGLLFITYHLSWVAYFTLNTLFMYYSLSIKSLAQHALKISDTFEKSGEDAAAEELSMIVSRDTAGMDEERIAVSAIESIGENFVDGVLSPIFYSMFFGGAGAVVFKVVSTMDSMFGYKNKKYINFGKVPAKLDDVLNFIPARLAPVPIFFSSWVSGFGCCEAMKTFIKFRKMHDSPNAGHGISLFAGALGVKLGGSVMYGGVMKTKPFIGTGRTAIIQDIDRAVSLMRVCSVTSIILSVIIVKGIEVFKYVSTGF